MNLPQAILAAMPGTMKQVAARIGVGGPLLWDTAKAMREAGFLVRDGLGEGGKLLYKAGDKPLPDGWEPHVPAAPAPTAVPEMPQTPAERRKTKKWPVLVCRIDGWPGHDPGRPMVWSIVYRGERRAHEECRRLNRMLKGEARLEVEMLTKHEAWKIRSKGFSLRLFKRRERELRRRAA